MFLSESFWVSKKYDGTAVNHVRYNEEVLTYDVLAYLTLGQLKPNSAIESYITLSLSAGWHVLFFCATSGSCSEQPVAPPTFLLSILAIVRRFGPTEPLR